MVYSNKFVTCILVNDQPQKELANSVVPIPFGAEYALRFRNKNNKRAVVKFWIDGENESGNGYIIPANSSVDIKRHFSKDAKFKFVNLNSSEAVDFGKNGPNLDGTKGLIEVRFYLEKDPVYIPYSYPQYSSQPLWVNSEGSKTFGAVDNSRSILRSKSLSTGLSDSTGTLSTANINLTCGTSSVGTNSPSLQEGCTVEGSISNQTFTTSYIDIESDFVEMKLVLKGYEVEQKVNMQPLTETSLFCTNCGNKMRTKDNFCGKCGTKV